VKPTQPNQGAEGCGDGFFHGAGDFDGDRVFVLCRLLKRVKLAFQHRCGHEMAGAVFYAVFDGGIVRVQIEDANVGAAVDERVAVAAF
jgi:hypothetical protein